MRIASIRRAGDRERQTESTYLDRFDAPLGGRKVVYCRDRDGVVLFHESRVSLHKPKYGLGRCGTCKGTSTPTGEVDAISADDFVPSALCDPEQSGGHVESDGKHVGWK